MIWYFCSCPFHVDYCMTHRLLHDIPTGAWRTDRHMTYRHSACALWYITYWLAHEVLTGEWRTDRCTTYWQWCMTYWLAHVVLIFERCTYSRMTLQQLHDVLTGAWRADWRMTYLQVHDGRLFVVHCSAPLLLWDTSENNVNVFKISQCLLRRICKKRNKTLEVVISIFAKWSK